MLNIRHLIAGAFVPLLAVPSAAAQDWTSVMIDTTTNNMSYFANTQVGVSAMCAAEGSCEGRQGKAVQPDMAANFARIDTSFRRDQSITRKVEADFLAEVKKRDADMGRQVETILRNNNIIEEYETEMSAYDISSKDLADVMSLFFAINWAQAQGRPYSAQTMPSPAQFESLRMQMEDALSQEFAAGRLDEAKVQEMTDSLIYYTMLQVGAWEFATENNGGAQLKPLSVQYADKFEQSFGLDMTSVMLTNSGFQPR